MKLKQIKPDVYEVDGQILSESGVRIAMQTPDRLPKGLKKLYEQFLKELGKEAPDARKRSKSSSAGKGEVDDGSGEEQVPLPADKNDGEGGD